MASRRRSRKPSSSRSRASRTRPKGRRRPLPKRPAKRKAAPRRRPAASSRAATRPRTAPGRKAAPARAPAPGGAEAAAVVPPIARPVDFPSWLRQQGARFTTQRHAEVFTAQEVAAAVRVTGYELAKVVVLNGDGRYALAVVPAPLRVDLKAARGILGAKKVSLAREEEFDKLFPGCDRGAMPPFGSLWGLPTYVDESLTSQPHIVFNAGSHIETVTMDYGDFERLARPTRARIAEHPSA